MLCAGAVASGGEARLMQCSAHPLPTSCHPPAPMSSPQSPCPLLSPLLTFLSPAPPNLALTIPSGIVWYTGLEPEYLGSDPALYGPRTSLSFFVPQFLHLYNKDNSSPHSIVVRIQ